MELFDAVQVHLGFNHFPVVLSVLAAVMLAIAMIIRNETVSKTALWIFVAAGAICIPVFLSGEGAEEIIEKMPGISENAIEEHEEIGKWALITCSITAVLSLIGLSLYNRAGRFIKPLVLGLAIISSVILIRTAHEGGLIRHTELNKATPDVQRGEGQEKRETETEHEN